MDEVLTQNQLKIDQGIEPKSIHLVYNSTIAEPVTITATNTKTGEKQMLYTKDTTPGINIFTINKQENHIDSGLYIFKCISGGAIRSLKVEEIE